MHTHTHPSPKSVQQWRPFCFVFKSGTKIVKKLPPGLSTMPMTRQLCMQNYSTPVHGYPTVLLIALDLRKFDLISAFAASHSGYEAKNNNSEVQTRRGNGTKWKRSCLTSIFLPEGKTTCPSSRQFSLGAFQRCRQK